MTSKTNRALKLSKVGRYYGTAHAMLNRIPDSVVSALTSAQLADLLDAMWSTCEDTKRIADRETIDAVRSL